MTAPAPDSGRPLVSVRGLVKHFPIKAGVFPLTKKDGQPEMAEKIAAALRKRFNVFYDEAGAIGRRYRRQDEAGTPFGITIDPDSTKNDDVTIRFRDDMGQVRVSTSKVIDVITNYIEADHARAEAGNVA